MQIIKINVIIKIFFVRIPGNQGNLGHFEVSHQVFLKDTKPWRMAPIWSLL